MKQISPRLLNWASVADENALVQAETTSKMPFIFPHVALMPDAHLGKGSTVGSVVPTRGAIMPACVGVDIGCGMLAVKTSHDLASLTGVDLSSIRASIESQVPLSAGNYNRSVKHDALVPIIHLEALAERRGASPDTYAKNWRLQLGSLGSGNHFIEVTVDEEGFVWLFLHSGSRGVGNKIAVHHIKVAQEMCDKYFIDLPDRDLAYLVEGTPEFDAYINEMDWAQKFAYLNREVMMSRVKDAFEHHAGPFDVLQEVNCHHNFTRKEQHFNQSVWLTRKGAISARKGEWGLIPGSMGTASYVVQGLGNPLALESAPHGAGRVHSRGSAKKTFDMASLEKSMEGIEWSHSAAFLDEHPGAYKEIGQVMADAADLVEIKHKLRQIVNVKGD